MKHDIQESQEVSPFRSGDDKAAMNRQESMTNMKYLIIKLIHKRSTALELSVKNILLEGLLVSWYQHHP